jgi:hypothetical protein
MAGEAFGRAIVAQAPTRPECKQGRYRGGRNNLEKLDGALAHFIACGCEPGQAILNARPAFPSDQLKPLTNSDLSRSRHR